MRMIDLIEQKKRGEALTEEEIRFLVRAYTAGEIPDYQMAAFAMAVWFRSMTPEETAWLTDAMARSGDLLDLSRFGTLSVDKHSTGGVGDKTTLIVVPIAAALGCRAAKMSGRGLGHTGGTIDKLEAIPGYRTTLTEAEFFSQVERVGAAVVAQSGNLTPADKKLYALRDVTATVDSIPLIASSVMSKKLAAGAHSIVLDVKVGSGAFMKTLEDAKALARTMTEIGARCGRRVSALLTNMDVPLGRAVGNALEVAEAMEVLRGGGPTDLRHISVLLAAEMASLALSLSRGEARRRAEEALTSGAAWEKAKEWIAAQGGDVRALSDPSLLPQADYTRSVRAERTGYIAHMDAESVGRAAMALGAGRKTKDDGIDLAAGVILSRKTGEFVREGDEVARLYTSSAQRADEGEAILRGALTFSDDAPPDAPLFFCAIRQ